MGTRKVLRDGALRSNIATDSRWHFDVVPRAPMLSGLILVSGFSRAKKRLDATLPQMPQWCFHDLRTTFATWLEELGIPRSVVSALLNHAGNSVTDIYTRANLLEQKRDAAERLGRLFVGIGEKEENTGQVVYLDSARI